eukprot:CAMPEP_0173221794 /NCGR_PEP_ID=MMETSP1142-20121109/2912_1 /TAXON_ID=483371 /ORGANISM="non described non described, Strain CCMP2298" /LENGTH=101 /DNA_ID=CAMNT_0014149851 /DNA_START=57 /DNA_END=362 /DNA_ORIENTATION=-
MSGEPTETNDESKEMLALPAPSDFEETGTTAALDFLGPIIVGRNDGAYTELGRDAGGRGRKPSSKGAHSKRRTDALKTDALKAEAKGDGEAERMLEAVAEA